MFIDLPRSARSALQRSAMFPAMVPDTAYVSLLRSDRKFFYVGRSINITSLRDREMV